MRYFTLLLLAFILFFKAKAQPCDTNALVIHKNFAFITDANITGDIARHHSFYNPLCTPKNTLLFYMVGTINYPGNDLLFPKLAANNGYHVVSIVYENSKSAKSSCFNVNDTTCYENFHKEVIFGTPVSDSVNVDSAHSIYNRILKQLQYLDNTYPSENWGQFLSGNTIDWTKVITAGHSQGSGHAAYLGHIYPVKRVLMFSGPNEYMNAHNRLAPWFATNNVTADSNYYAFGNTNDEVSFDHQYQAWNKIGLNNYGDTLDVNQHSCPFNNRRMLFTDSTATGFPTPNHNSTMVDNFTPKDGNEIPLYKEAWEYMLDLCGITTSIDDNSKNSVLSLHPNPTNEQINIQLMDEIKEVEIKVSDVLGKTVFLKKYAKLKSTTIDLNQIKRGVYIVNISALTFNQSIKILKN